MCQAVGQELKSGYHLSRLETSVSFVVFWVLTEVW